MKRKSLFVCQECGLTTPRWQGKCHDCGAWNSFVEEIKDSGPEGSRSTYQEEISPGHGKLISIAEVSPEREERVKTCIKEFDRVLGGGLVTGMFILIGGDPGIGKSTLVLQICRNLNQMGKTTIYVTGEESPAQIKIRAERLKAENEKLLVYPEISFERISDTLKKNKPDLVVVDSIQTIATGELSGTPGSIGQIREVAARFMMYAKSTGVPVIIVGHVTKDGMIAGPKVLEHMVDTVLYFEGDSDGRFRILRAVKNRFGSTNEIGVFEMTGSGLEEVSDPGEIFINREEILRPGAVIVPSIEGTRPILIELQALVSNSNYGVGRRTSLGVDQNRVSMLLAIIEKHFGISTGNRDVFLNVVGGLKIADTALDIGIIMAIISSIKDITMDQETVFLGEAGLTGEVRSVSCLESRIEESRRLGFKKIVLPEAGTGDVIAKYKGIEFKKLRLVRELLEI